MTNSSVIAFPNELDRWLKATSTDETSHVETDPVRQSNTLQMHRIVMSNLIQNLNLMMETIVKIRHRSDALEESRNVEIKQPHPDLSTGDAIPLSSPSSLPALHQCVEARS